MTDRKIIAVETDGNTFKFYAEPTVSEKQRIKTLAADLAGGIDNLAMLESTAENAYLQHFNLVNNKYPGKTEIMENELTELGKDETKKEEYNALFDKIYGNVFYIKFIKLTKEKKTIMNYAYLQAMVIEPKNYNFFNQQEDLLERVVKEVQEQLKFFREPVKET